MIQIRKVYSAILIVLVVVLLIITWLAINSTHYDDYKLSFFYGVNFCIGLIVLNSLLFALLVIINWASKYKTFFGRYSKSRFLAFGIVFILFSKTIISVISTSINPMIYSFRLLVDIKSVAISTQSSSSENSRDAYLRGYSDGYDEGFEDAGPQVEGNRNPLQIKEQRNDYLKAVSNIAVQWGKTGLQVPLSSIQSLIAGSVLMNVLLALILTAFLGYLFDIYIFDEGEESFKVFLSEHRFTLLFISIFIFGSFLSISAIIAIPEVKRSNDKSGLLTEDFNESIKNIEVVSIGNSNEIGEFDIIPYNTFLTKLDTLKSKVRANKTDSVRNVNIELTTPQLSELESEIETLIRNSENAVRELKELKENYTDHINQLRTALMNDYSYTTNNYGAAEDVRRYFRDLIDYFNNYSDDYSNYISNNNKTLEDKFEYNLQVLASLENMVDNNRELGSTFFSPPKITNFRAFLTRPRLRESSEDNKNNFFKKIASWLIDTKSDEMVLVAGMLGFGFLGAGVSSRIRTRSESKDQYEYKQGVSSVLIAGVSASLVVFLGAKGGFAIFSNDEINLNPYTLLFLCLIGAVYSEAVWAKAYRYLGDAGSNENGDNDAKSDKDKENSADEVEKNKPDSAKEIEEVSQKDSPEEEQQKEKDKNSHKNQADDEETEPRSGGV